MNFFNDIINSSPVINTATILSLILAIIIFLYQEVKQRKEQQKEIIRLKEEVINLVIRNHVNSGVQIFRIDLDSLIEGFEKNKNCKLNMERVDIVKMIYARVCENEHISNDIRLELLKQLEEMLENLRYEVTNTTIQDESGTFSFFTSRVSLIISLVCFIFIVQSAQYFESNLNLNNVLKVAMVFVPIILLILINPLLDNSIKKLVGIIEDSFFLEAKKEKKDKNSNLTEQNYQLSLSNLNNEVKEEVKFNEFFNDSEEIRQVFEQRIIIEAIIRQLYFNIFNEETKMPVFKMISLLIDEDVFSKKLSYKLKQVYSASSHVVHEGKLPPGIDSFDQLINLMKESAFVINSILNDYTEKSKDVS
ncbi:hypothetical protein [Bacillus bingmayongensis]|uniref:hypothetical protein n=1 Tax=Bacillus bingmayongensis TaxID=1150157 RepID=UPI001C8E54C3|nr:hypothetical protein [Bacillus bingmayongensis]MBY0600162.1 hypothetical protein [Bacillus bingmayongensis]